MIGLDPYSWVALWKMHKLDEVDFDRLQTIHSQDNLTTRAFLILVSKLRLTVEIVQVDEEDRTFIFAFQRGLMTRYEEVKGGSSIWEEREYDELGQMIERKGSMGTKQRFFYDLNGKLVNVEWDEKTEKNLRSLTHAEVSDDGTLMEISC